MVFVTEYFVGNPVGDARHLAQQSKSYLEAVKLGYELSQIDIPEQETGFGLPRLAGNWLAVRQACKAEAFLEVDLPGTWLE